MSPKGHAAEVISAPMLRAPDDCPPEPNPREPSRQDSAIRASDAAVTVGTLS